MFKNLAADALGLSDIGKIIDPKDYDMTDVDDYVFSEDDERIFLVIKSKSDEYCFTNIAFIHLSGNMAVSKKRVMKRYPYKHYPIGNVFMETAGTVDLDAEIKFSVGDQSLSIDIDKKQIERIKDLYKALFAISEKCIEIRNELVVLQETYEAIKKMFVLRELPENVVLSLPDMITQTAQQVEAHYNERRRAIRDYDFGWVFEHYLQQ